jgi:hypothetical protein
MSLVLLINGIEMITIAIIGRRISGTAISKMDNTY